MSGANGSRSVELVFFDGCPNAGRARENLREALDRSGTGGEWEEWDLESSALPGRLRGYGSPTVLVDGRDVTGEDPESVESDQGGIACRADGAPSIEEIVRALAHEGGTEPAEGRSEDGAS